MRAAKRKRSGRATCTVALSRAGPHPALRATFSHASAREKGDLCVNLAPVGLRRDDRRYYGNYTRINRRKHDTSLSFWTHHGCNLESNAPERSARASRALKAGDARAPLMCEIRYGEGRDDGTTSIARNGIAN